MGDLITDSFLALMKYNAPSLPCFLSFSPNMCVCLKNDL